MPRSHKPRKRYVPKRVAIDTIGLAHAQASLLQPAQRRDLTVPMQHAFERLRAGQGTGADWCNLADAMNVAERLAEINIASDRMPEFNAAQAVLAELHQRAQQRGSYTMRGPEIATLATAVELHDVQLEVCTQGEAAHAITTVKRCIFEALAGNASPKARICVGGLGSNEGTTHV
jgi:hypothetical protein